ncbi:DNA repair protein endonuclease SAE2/CtIP C-terminus-domain-containing protein [Amylocarpus encephaloides]|uniref:DNA repair protein endonuclease SAE2/CtIP C-terminus-domain-containing protein n=1 Tax=Amylocarpus encephaloides TaxID=45428 RepID=A0A9P8C9H2_9HELO|nr:DNA repair protein endonuclease SAE2/CtIP C-terminus-domain-containing protein [Amylocarpus encephaloides]
MESWREGRDDLFAELTKICTRIDRNVAAGICTWDSFHNLDLITLVELDKETFTRVGNDKLRDLQQRAGSVDGLIEENTRLVNELRDQRSENAPAPELERENKRLREEVKKLRREKEATEAKEKLDGPSRSATPTSTGLEAKLSGNGRDMEKYNALVTKHNNLHTSYQISKAHLGKLIPAVRKRNEEIARMEKAIEARDRRLENLRKKLGITEGKTKDANREESVGGPIPSSSKIVPKEDAARVVKQDVAMPTSRHDQPDGEKPDGNNLLHTKARLVEDMNDAGIRTSAASFEANRPIRSESLMLPNLLGEGQMPVEESQYVDLTQIQQKPRSPPNPQQHSDSTEGEPLSPDRNTESKRASTAKTSEVPNSPDTLLVVSARRIRKRKLRGDKNETESPVKVKIEEIEFITSSPIGLAALHHIDHADSFDLDEIGEKVDTPKKRRRLMELSRQASRISAGGGGSSNHGRAATNNSPLSRRVTSSQHSDDVSRAASPLQPLNHNQLLLPRKSKLTAPTRRPLASDIALKSLSEDAQTVLRSVGTSKDNTDTSDSLDDLMTRPSPPKRILGRIYEPPTRHSANRGVDNSSSMRQNTIHVLNSVTDLSSASVTSNSPKSLEPRQSSASLSTSTSLARPSSDGSSRSGRDPLQRAKPIEPPGLNYKRSSNLATPTPRYVQKATPGSTATTSRDRLSRLEEPLRPPDKHQRAVQVSDEDTSIYDIDPEEEPLRIRPLETLKLSDFKVNPKANQGLDYAFTDVVRNRADRRCLPGCTKLECCGTGFRALAEMMMDNPTKSQEEKDQELLEEYMGNNAYKLQNMTIAQREEMLLQARTRDMANKYGRHRHAYERERSPPGFWDADFPTTQEHLAQREKANERERETIEKRYKEAMRPGGAYMFRDER